jgi:hypothetical protein
MVGRISVVFRLLGDGVVEGSVHDEHGVLAERLARLEREQDAELGDDTVRGGLRDAE